MKETQIRIVSDGTREGTKVFSGDGSRIKNVQAIKFEANLESCKAVVYLKIKGVSVDFIVDSKVSYTDDDEDALGK